MISHAGFPASFRRRRNPGFHLRAETGAAAGLDTVASVALIIGVAALIAFVVHALLVTSGVTCIVRDGSGEGGSSLSWPRASDSGGGVWSGRFGYG